MRPFLIRLALPLFLTLTAPAFAECVGQNLLDNLPAEDQAALDKALAGQPFPSGNHWKATKGDATIHVIGTFHLFDPRMEDAINHLEPFIQHSDDVYLEATDKELQQLQTEVTRRPDLLFIGPKDKTLPERLSEPEWQALQKELTARGLPPFFAAKFQPWYVTVLLGVPVCAMSDLKGMPKGLDTLIMASANQAHIPLHALEPFDTLFKIFGTLSPEDQTDLLRTSLAMSDQAQDMFSTMTDAYFAQDTLRLWEFSRIAAAKAPGFSPDDAAKDFDVMQDALLTRRNKAWMDVIIPAAQHKTITVAVGAAHLAGKDGILNLLQQAGFALEQAPF